MIGKAWRRALAPIASAALLGLLAACGGLLPEPPQRQLYRLAPSVSFPAPLPHVAAQLLVAAPSAPAGLDTRRVALSRSPVSLDYYADAEWEDRVPFLVQAALVDAFDRSGSLAGVGPERLGLRFDFVLETAITDFQAVYDAPDRPPHAVVGLVAKLIRMPDRQIVAQASFRGDAPAAVNALADIVRAFDAALGDAAQQVVSWTVTNPALSRRAGSLLSRPRFVHLVGGDAS